MKKIILATASLACTLMPALASAGTKSATSVDIVVSAFTDSTVTAFSKSGAKLSQLKGSFLKDPVGLTTDAQGAVYIANEGQSNILVYAPPFNGVPVALADPGFYPTGVAQLGNGTWIAANNVTSTTNTHGNIVVFKSGKLVKTIDTSLLFYPEYCAFDSTGNLFVAGTDVNNITVIGEVAKAAGNGDTFLTLSTTNAILAPGGIQVAADGQIVILDQGSFARYTYNKPTGGPLGAPVATTRIKGVTLPMSFAFTGSNKNIWVTDWRNADALEFAYPAGGTASQIFKGAGISPGGVAVNPAASD